MTNLSTRAEQAKPEEALVEARRFMDSFRGRALVSDRETIITELAELLTAREAAARAEGRREGIEEAATAIESRIKYSKVSAAAIRALAEKQP